MVLTQPIFLLYVGDIVLTSFLDQFLRHIIDALTVEFSNDFGRFHYF
jgi:uncharacterized membrane protein (DUF485 family)